MAWQRRAGNRPLRSGRAKGRTPAGPSSYGDAVSGTRPSSTTTFDFDPSA